MPNKHLTRLFFILIFLTLSTGAYLILPTPSQNIIQKPVPKNIAWSNVATNTTITNSIQKTTDQTPNTKKINEKNEKILPSQTEILTTTTAEDKPAPNELDVAIDIAGQLYNLKLPEKTNVHEAMQQLINAKKITADMKEYVGMGYFIEEINGLKNNNQTGEYWIYYTNGQSAKIGISAYVLKNNDLITWKYEHSKF